jgi:hypothetical protein
VGATSELGLGVASPARAPSGLADRSISSPLSKSPPRSGGGNDGTLELDCWPPLVLMPGALRVVNDGGATDRAKRLENGDSLFSPHMGDGGDRSVSLPELLVTV